MRADFLDILELLKIVKSLGPLAANKDGADSAYNTLKQSKLFAGLDLNRLSDTKANELVSKTGMKEIDIGSPEFLGFYAAEPNTQFGNNSLLNKKQASLCKLSEIEQQNLNYVQAVKNNEFQFIVLKIQGKFYKAQPEDLVELSLALLPDSIREVLKQFGMNNDILRKMLASKIKGAE